MFEYNGYEYDKEKSYQMIEPQAHQICLYTIWVSHLKAQEIEWKNLVLGEQDEEHKNANFLGWAYNFLTSTILFPLCIMN